MKISRELIDKIVSESHGRIESIILDQWRTKKDQWSLTYGYKSCDNQCETCKIHVVSTMPDIISMDSQLRTFQIPASEENRRNYGDQRALNCKTIDQYVKNFVTCFTKGYTLDSIDEELGYVAGFKLLYLNGVSDLESAEKQIKRRIVNEVLDNYKDEKSKEIFTEKAKQLNLF